VPISSNQKPLRVQVIAMDWKWLFIYPEQGIATVNSLELPVGRPVNFNITSDAPMNSFWIPQLGGQIYAMPGMSTTLNLRADKVGEYRGSSANISGVGFANMHFIAHATEPTDFSAWVGQTKQGATSLNNSTYAALAKPGTSKAHSYADVSDGLYTAVVHKYMSNHGRMEGVY
jgi:cytochrome o ubiquinol oxidase subunit 2